MTQLENQKKIISMMITAHSVLRDRYLNLSSLFENGLLIAAAFLNAFVFIDAQFITKITSISEQNQKLIIGIISIIVFAISIVLLQVKWKEKAENHATTANQLFDLMQECKTIVALEDSPDKNLLSAEFFNKYTEKSATLTKIPEKKFHALKLKHYRKVELGKLIDKYPGSRLFILKIKMFLSSFEEKK